MHPASAATLTEPQIAIEIAAERSCPWPCGHTGIWTHRFCARERFGSAATLVAAAVTAAVTAALICASSSVGTVFARLKILPCEPASQPASQPGWNQSRTLISPPSLTQPMQSGAAQQPYLDQQE